MFVLFVPYLNSFCTFLNVGNLIKPHKPQKDIHKLNRKQHMTYSNKCRNNNNCL